MPRRQVQRATAAGETLEDRTLLATFVVTNFNENTANGTSLREAVMLANNNPGFDVIEMRGVTANISQGELRITDDVRIEGDNAIIDAGERHRVFRVQGADLELEDVRVRRGSTSFDGAAILVQSGDLTLTNVEFTGHFAGGDGGAIATNGSILADQVRFEDNRAGDDGGAIDAVGSSVVTVARSRFIDNTAGGVGGGIATTTSVFSDANTFDGNVSGAGGAAISADYAGLPLADRVAILTNNQATDNLTTIGDGGFLLINEGSATLLNNVLGDNLAPLGQGGAVASIEGNLISFGDVLQRNRATDGGGYYIEGGLARLARGTIGFNPESIDNMPVTAEQVRNVATGEGNRLGRGGGLFATGEATVELGRLSLGGNRAGLGGGLAINGGSLVARDNLVFENTATTAGGGLHVAGAADVRLVNTRVAENLSEGDGGGLAQTLNTVGGIAGRVRLFSSIFDGNTATGSGGGIASEATLALNGSQIQLNTAGVDGGGIAQTGSRLIMRESSLAANTAGGQGGGALVRSGTLLSVTSLFVENNADRGGGVAGQQNATLLLIGGTVRGNAARVGGGLAGVGGGKVQLTDGAAVVGNETTGEGGGVLLRNNAFLLTNDATIAANTAGTDGAGVYIRGGRADLNNTLVRSNTAGRDGGGLYYDAEVSSQPVLNLRNVAGIGNEAGGDGGFADVLGAVRVNALAGAFNNNVAGGNGGAFALDDPVILAARFGMSLVNNRATGLGGGLYSAGGQVGVTDGFFRGNQAARGAGVYRAAGTGQLRLQETTFNKNVASQQGGGVYSADRASVVRSVFTGNRAAAGAGLFAAVGGVIDLTAPLFAGNVAGNTGGPGQFV